MSILMDALKQQSPVVAPVSTFWRNLAFFLALLLAVLSGFVAGYLWLPKTEPVLTPSVLIAQPEPAPVSSIVNALQQSSSALTKPAAVASAAAQAEPVTEVLPPAPQVVTVTAPPVNRIVNATPTQIAEPEVSEELRDRFANALAATAEVSSRPQVLTTHNAPAQDISMLDPILLQQIPRLRFEAHVFATSPAQRWVKVNGRSLQEGQWVTADIRLREITPHYVLLEFGQTLFSMRALSEW